MKCDFQVGDEVVCVGPIVNNDLFISATFGITLPELDAVYTVRAVGLLCGGVVIWLKEIENKQLPGLGGREPGFRWPAFRKVEKPKRSTSIEVFRSIDRDVFAKPKVTA